MSIGGPSPLGTLLVQRVEAALGTTLSQQANVVSGARPDAVTQPANPDPPDPTRNETQRHPREAVDRAMAQTEQQGRHAIDRAKLDVRTAALLLARGAPNTSATPSAPTTLGHAARTILALLANFSEQPPAVIGKRPLISAGGQGHEAGNARAGRGGSMDGGLSGAGSAARGATAGGAPAGNASAGSAAASASASGASTAAVGGAGVGAAAAAAAGSMAGAGLAGTMAGQLAQALAQALQSSGMFYESHLNGLAFGKQSLSQLMQEPQALLGRAASRAGGQAGGATSTAQGSSGPGSTATQAHAGATAVPAGGESSAAAGAAARMDATGLATAAAAQSLAGSTAGTSPLPGLDPQTHLLVRQQLEVLANQSFSWRGEAWPDAPMDWEISRREASSPDEEAGPQTDHWATRITIQLPQLGSVQARLTLAGQQLVMHLVAPESAELLGQHTEALRTRYSSQGFQLSQISIAADDVEASVSSGFDANVEAGGDTGAAAEGSVNPHPRGTGPDAS